MKLNDWIVAGITNPEFTTNDFVLSGLNIDNTLLLSKEQYKSSPFVRLAFSEDGNFKENDFNEFYDKRAKEFGVLQALNYDSDTFIYSPLDPRAKDNSRIMSPDFELKMVANPNKEVRMFTGTTYSDTKSTRERSLEHLIWDTAKQEWKDYSVNDISLFNDPIGYFKSFLEEPLVYATYDENGEHYDPFTGLMVSHQKGLYKLDEFGNTYTETLNGRSAIGKEVVSTLDYITVDGQGFNKYDPFDSDGLDKNVGGTVMKTVLLLSPFFMGSTVSNIYNTVLISKEILKTLPMLYGISTSLFNTPDEIPILNTLAAKGQSFTSGISDAGKSSMLNYETGFSLISDIALLFGQLKTIFNGINKLRGTKNLAKQAHVKAGIEYLMQRQALSKLLQNGTITKQAFDKYVGDVDKWTESIIGSKAIEKYMKEIEPIIKKSNRIGADASLAYMALVSNTDVYDSMLLSGASRKEAAAVTLGSAIGMFSVDKYLHLGELFFDDLTAGYERQIRKTITKEAKSWYDNTISRGVITDTTKEVNRIKKLFQGGIESGRKATSKFIENLKYHSTGLGGKALGEGLEEFGEELVSDLSKGIYELSGYLGADTSTKDVGAFDNALARYGMSFLGGSLGGGLFYGIDIYLNGKFTLDETLNELIYLVRNGKTKEILETLDSWKKKGKLGSNVLSTKSEIDSKGNKVFITANLSEESQNDFIYNRIKETVLLLDAIINANDANLSEDQLFEKMILSESRFRDLKQYLDILNFSYTTGYQLDFQKTLSRVADLEMALKRANQTITGLNYSREEDFLNNLATDETLRHLSPEEQENRNSNILKIKNDLDLAKKELNKFLKGEYSLEYTDLMLFALDEHLNSEFTAMNYKLWLKKHHSGKTPEELSPADAIQYKLEYLQYKNSIQEKDLKEKYAIYKAIKEQMDPILVKILDGSAKFKTFLEEILKLFSEDSPFQKLKQYKYDDVLDFNGETEDSESYINRYDDENIRIREEIINKYNSELYDNLLSEIQKIVKKSGGFIDPVTRRKLKLILNNRNKDLINEIIRNLSIDISRTNKSGTLNSLDESILNILKSELSSGQNIDLKQILNKIKQTVTSYYKTVFNEENELSGKLYSYLLDNDIISGTTDYIEGSELLDWVNSQLDEGKNIEEIFNIDSGLFLDNFEDYILTKNDVKEFLDLIKTLYNEEFLNNWVYSRKDTSEESLESNDFILNEITRYNNAFGQLEKELENNSLLKLNQYLDKSISEINPIIDLIKSLGLSLNKDLSNLENILKKIDARYEAIENTEDLILTNDEKESLDEAAYILKLADSYLYAASNAPNALFPYGHNHVINEMAENHKDIYNDYKLLPVLSSDVAFMYSLEIGNYLEQIGILDERTNKYNIGSYRWLSALNEMNKSRMFINADKAWHKTIYDLLTKKDESGKSIFKFTYEDKEIDLLEGCGTIPFIDENTSDGAVVLNLALNAFYEKIQSLRKEGWSYREIWERSELLKKISNVNEVPDLKTCSLDENITVDRMTSYDKVIFIATIGAMNSTEFYSFLYERVEEEENIAPLTIQEWVSRVGIAATKNPDIFNETLEYIKTETGTKLPIIYNTVFANGSAGAGKTRVVGRNIAKYDKEGVLWLSAPKESQINTLFESISKGVKMLNRDSNNTSEEFPVLMELLGIDLEAYKQAFKLISEYDKTLERIQDPDYDTSYLTMEETHSSYIINIIPSKFGIKKIENPPALIIIDEATHLSNLEILILSHFCKVNGTKLKLLGDNKLKGFGGFGFNISKEHCLVVRTPTLGISLRDNNIQHLYNLKTLEAYIDELLNLDSRSSTYKQEVEKIGSYIKNIRFKCYTNDDINGEVLVPELNSTLVSKMKGSVGYVGNPNSNTLTILKESGLDPIVMTENDVLGLEFDYVVIDKDFEIPKEPLAAVFINEFLLDLYTMISRGKNGSIIIDSSGALQSAIGQNRVENTKTKASDISTYTKEFRENKINTLKKILGSKTVLNEENEPGTSKPVKKKDKKLEEKINLNEKIILDNEIDYSSLDFEHNYYFLVPYSSDLNELESGLDIKNGTLGEHGFLANETIIQDFIRESKKLENIPLGILYKFPKSEFGNDIKNSEELKSKLELIEESIEIIPNKYIDLIILIVSEELENEEKTSEKDLLKPIDSKLEDLPEFIDDDGKESFEIGLEDLPDNPILCYGEATFTGMDVETVDGKLVWINSNPHEGAVKRDLQIFTSAERITDTDELITLSTKIKTLKKAFLYKKSYNELPNYITDIISEDEFNSIEWYIEAREKTNLDNFIRNIAFKEAAPTGSKNLMFTVIGKFKLSDGSDAKITLGLMGNPNTWKKSIEEGIPQKRINKKIDKLNQRLGRGGISAKEKSAIKKQILYYENQLKSLNLQDKNSAPKKYISYIESISSEYNGTPVIKRIRKLITPGLTDIHKLKRAIPLIKRSTELIRNAESRLKSLNEALKKVKGSSITKALILAEIDNTNEQLKKFREIKDHSFWSLNPNHYTVKSPMYIYTPSNAIKSNSDIDDSLVGKYCVMFVSNDTSLDPEKLVDIYISLKDLISLERIQEGIVDLKSSNTVPSVRMIVLTNLGVSFLDLSNPYLKESMESEVSFVNKKGNQTVQKNIYPFKTNYMGIRMYVGLWNFRANLLQFKQRFDRFVKKLPIDASKLDEYLIVKDLKWRQDNGKELSSELSDYLNKHISLENFEEVSKLIDDFNDSLGNKVKQFRLGSDLTNGAYVRRLTGNLTTLYKIDKEKVNGIYLNSSTLNKYLDISESLFTNVLDHIVTCNQHKFRLLSVKTGIKNSFANHITSIANSNGKIQVNDTYSNEEDIINFGSTYDPSGSKGVLNTFSHIPAVLSKVFKFTSLRQKHINALSFDEDGNYSIKIIGTIEENGKEVLIEKNIPYRKLWKHVDMINMSDDYDESLLDGYVFDRNLSNFFSFAFHGTLEDVLDRSVQHASDALFPYGFFADPVSSTEYVYNGSEKMFVKAVLNPLFFGADVKIEDPTFFISLVDLEENMHEDKKPEILLEDNSYKESCNKLLDMLIALYPEFNDKFEIVKNDLDVLSEKEMQSYLENLVKSIFKGIIKSNFETIFGNDDVVINKDSLIYLQKWDSALTLEQYVQKIYKEKFDKDFPNFNNDNIRKVGTKLIIDVGEVSVQIISNRGQTIDITELKKEPVSSETVNTLVENLIKELNEHLDDNDIDRLNELLKYYKDSSDESKLLLKEDLIKVLLNISMNLIGNGDIFTKVRGVITKILDLNC